MKQGLATQRHEPDVAPILQSGVEFETMGLDSTDGRWVATGEEKDTEFGIGGDDLFLCSAWVGHKIALRFGTGPDVGCTAQNHTELGLLAHSTVSVYSRGPLEALQH